MRVVLDTNVVVSGVFFGGVPRAVLEMCEEGRVELVLTPSILDEYLRSCDRLAEGRPTLSYGAVLLRLVGEGSMVADSEADTAVTRDPDDDKFMLCARDSGARVVSGDKDLLEVNGWDGVEVLTPRELLDRVSTEDVEKP